MTLKTLHNAVEEAANERARCRWCRHAIAGRAGRGRPRQFCSQACRQWDWVARQRSAELKLAEDELVVTRGELDELKDKIFVLACALEDVRDDIHSKRMTLEAMRESLRWLVDAAQPVTETHLGGRPSPSAMPDRKLA